MNAGRSRSPTSARLRRCFHAPLASSVSNLSSRTAFEVRRRGGKWELHLAAEPSHAPQWRSAVREFVGGVEQFVQNVHPNWVPLVTLGPAFQRRPKGIGGLKEFLFSRPEFVHKPNPPSIRLARDPPCVDEASAQVGALAAAVRGVPNLGCGACGESKPGSGLYFSKTQRRLARGAEGTGRCRACVAAARVLATRGPSDEAVAARASSTGAKLKFISSAAVVEWTAGDGEPVIAAARSVLGGQGGELAGSSLGGTTKDGDSCMSSFVV